MKREYKYKGMDWHLAEDIPGDYHIKEHIEESYFECDRALNYNNISGILRKIKINGVSIDYVEAKHKEPIEMDVKQDGDHLEICFELDGHKQYVQNNGERLETLNGRYSFFYFKELNGSLFFFPENGNRRCIEIELSIAYLNRLLNNDLSVLGEFGEKLQEKENTVFINNSTISLQMRCILKELIEPSQKLSGVLRKIEIESLINNLILLVVLQVKKISQEGLAIPTLSQEDISKIHRARKIILEKIDTPCSLLELARLSGINDFKLKKGFKEVFGTTVFKYLFDERMERSKTLLLEEKLTISEIAFMIGYKNPAHFTAAFKRKFGYPPSDLKKFL